MISSIITVYVLYVDIAELTLSDFCKSGQNNENYRKLSYDQLNAYTREKIKISKKNGSNVNIIFIDEVDEQIATNKKANTKQSYSYGYSSNEGSGSYEQHLLKLFSNELTFIHDSVLKVDIEARNTMFIFAANKSFVEVSPDLKPLQSRFIQIDFPALDPSMKHNILYKNVEKIYEQYDLTLTAQDKEYFDSLLEHNNLPGVRELLGQARDYIRERANTKIFMCTAWEQVKLNSAAANSVDVIFKHNAIKRRCSF